MGLSFLRRERTSTIHARMSETWAGRRLHFIGIGGAGMSGLALVAHALGATVTGSDRAESSYSERLRAAGSSRRSGTPPRNVPEDAEVVVSTAIGDDNPELAHRPRARAAGPAPRRPAGRGRRGSSAASPSRARTGRRRPRAMVAHVLVETGRDPAYLIGGELRSTGTNAAWGRATGSWSRPTSPTARS